jgi:hypothetical protein
LKSESFTSFPASSGSANGGAFLPISSAMPYAYPAAARSAGAQAGCTLAAVPRKTEVLLAWARDRDGAKVHAARLDAASRRARAPFTCLGCGEPLVAKLGPVRARHFAHEPGSRCPLTAPETALHLDAKERLVALCEAAFAGARRVAVVVRCPTCRRPSSRDLADLGDAAVEEGAVGALRADVLVRSRGRPALALEVKVTHALEPGKEAALAAAGVPAVEIDAREPWEREGDGSVEILASRSVGFPTCAACVALARADADRARGGGDRGARGVPRPGTPRGGAARPSASPAVPGAAGGPAVRSRAGRDRGRVPVPGVWRRRGGFRRAARAPPLPGVARSPGRLARVRRGGRRARLVARDPGVAQALSP